MLGLLASRLGVLCSVKWWGIFSFDFSHFSLVIWVVVSPIFVSMVFHKP
jgi:hypothetical protein